MDVLKTPLQATCWCYLRVCRGHQIRLCWSHQLLTVLFSCLTQGGSPTNGDPHPNPLANRCRQSVGAA
jgi:hypothetical protein